MTRAPSIRGIMTVAAVLAGLGIVSHASPPLALVNETSSLPKGLYLRALDQTLRRAAIVAVNPPAAARRYLASLGMPARDPLLKRVVAFNGEAVCRTGQQVRWSGRSVVASARDRHGVALPVWSGCRRLGTDEVFVLGDTSTSFDSRYFGPVSRSSLVGVYKEALRW